MNVKVLFWIFILIANYGSIAIAGDRRALVEGVFHSLPVLFHFISDQPIVDEWNTSEKELLAEVIQIAESGSLALKWSNQPSDFRELLPNLPIRLMRIRTSAPKTIDVNHQMVSDESVMLNVALLVKLFMHEMSHQTSLGDLGFRDRVAQKVSEILEPYQTKGSGTFNGGHLEVFSLPSEKILSDISGVEFDQPQGSFLIFKVNKYGDYTDITGSVFTHLEKQKKFIRSQWRVEEKMINKYFRELSEFMRALLDLWFSSGGQIDRAIPIFEELGLKVNFKFSDLSKKPHQFKEVKMITVLEIHESRWLSTGQFSFVATYSVKPTGRTHFLDLNQLSLLRPLTAPMLIRGGQNSHEFYSEVRPEFDYSVKATILDEKNAKPNEVVVNVRGPLDGNSVHLVLELSSGTFYLKPFRRLKMDRQKDQFYFRIPVGLLRSQKVIYAHSIQVDTNKTVWLDKSIVIEGLSKGEANLGPNTMLADSLGAWGYSGGQRVLKRANDFFQPEYVLDHVSGLSAGENKVFFFDPIDLKIQFSMLGSSRVKQVRFHFVRSIIAGYISKQKISDFKVLAFIDSNGRNVQLSTRMDPALREDFYEVVVANLNQIEEIRSATESVVVAKFKLPVRWSSQATGKDVVHYLPLLSPVLVEAVLENGQVIRQNFSSEIMNDNSCSVILDEGPPHLPIGDAAARLRKLIN